VTAGFFTDTSICIGCKACEVACKQWNQLPDDGFTFTGMSYDNTGQLDASTWRHVKFIERPVPLEGVQSSLAGFSWLMMSDVCKHCTHAACLESCPTGAILRTEVGSTLIQADVCNGCGTCNATCPFGVADKLPGDGRSWKCTMCYDRQVDGLTPACAKACPTGAIQFGSKEDMKDYAAKRVTDLKERGYEQAGLYDPQGVGGTHVMYVLHHADKPDLYAGLPANPSISPLVSLWKGFAKPLATLALAGVALGSLFHYVTKGPNEVSKEIEDEIEREDKEEAK
jgi:formate dehydrogenase iron-sulfur subunit